MNVICASTSLSIARSAFQFILHHALLWQSQPHQCGLLGIDVANNAVIQHSPLCSSAQKAEIIIQTWQDKGIVCVGLYYFSPEVDISHLLTVIPSTYIELFACLDEKGRLDLFAKQRDVASTQQQSITLTLTEDGQSATNV
ncbi:MAG: hypothetical protein Q9M19_06025 [Mariprofundaceae bacterium]|nr:hypothetical protein [Mariprofundaceae bacterium]